MRPYVNITVPVLASLLLGACGTSTSPAAKEENEVVHGAAPTSYAIVDDNIRHDTLLIQTTFDMGDGSFVMVAGNVDPTFEGIRLYRYKAQPDSTGEILAASSPGYDSWTMLPTFFPITGRAGEHLVLANFGERESWGQKLIRMDAGFTDLGFLDVAYPERITEDDTSYVKRTNIGPHSRLTMKGDTAVFTFDCDSLFLYDDMDGGLDQMVPAASVRYSWHPATGLMIWRDGRQRPVKPLS